MANESTYALISDVLPAIWEAALDYAKAGFIMPSLVKTFTDYNGMVTRNVSEYVETGVTDNLGEVADLTTTAFDRALLTTLTPKEIGKQFIITDRRVDTDTEDVFADAARDIGYVMGKKLEQDLLGVFPSFTLTPVGAKASAFDMGKVMAARAILEANNVPGPYTLVLHPYQYLDIYNTFTALASPASLSVRDEISRSYYVTQYADLTIAVSNLPTITTDGDGTWATAALFSRDAIALDIRRGFRIEPERNASLRSTELNATMIYAVGAWRPTWGIEIWSDATTPA